MLTLLITALLCLSALAFSADSEEEVALARLALVTDMLISTGDEMVSEPVAGMLVVEDAVSIDLLLSSQYSYQLVMWTESTFNQVYFRLISPGGEVPQKNYSDHTTFSVMPFSKEPGLWNLQLELLEGASSDTAYYAMAVLRQDRILQVL